MGNQTRCRLCGRVITENHDGFGPDCVTKYDAELTAIESTREEMRALLAASPDRIGRAISAIIRAIKDEPRRYGQHISAARYLVCSVRDSAQEVTA